MPNKAMLVRGSGTAVPVISRVPTGDVSNAPCAPVKSKRPLPDKVYSPVAVGNGTPGSRARESAPSGGAKMPISQRGCKEEVPPLSNAKQPVGVPDVRLVRSLIMVHV